MENVQYWRRKDQWRTQFTALVPRLAAVAAMLICAAYSSVEAHVIGQVVWHDLNRNGIRDNGEPGIDGVNVKVYSAPDNRLLGSQSTENGMFHFVIDSDTKIYLTFEPPIGFAFTAAFQGQDPQRNSDVDPTTGQTATIPLLPKSDRNELSHLDAGLVNKLFERRAGEPPPPNAQKISVNTTEAITTTPAPPLVRIFHQERSLITRDQSATMARRR